MTHLVLIFLNIGLLLLFAMLLQREGLLGYAGWPTSSWLDRLAVGVFVANLMRLPKVFPKLTFAIEHIARPGARQGQAAAERAAGS